MFQDNKNENYFSMKGQRRMECPRFEGNLKKRWYFRLSMLLNDAHDSKTLPMRFKIV